MKKLLIASHNPNKIKEFKQMLNHYADNIITLADLNDHEEVIEDQDSFLGNALKKAMYFAKKYDMLTLADDSGLTVDALDGRPGIFSARYSGKGDIENNLKIIKEMRGISNRKAQFIAYLVLASADGNYHFVKGSVEGEITHAPKGVNGFGYDAIFFSPTHQKTYAEINSDEKHKVSHRGQALIKLKEYLDETINNQ